ncbi:MAG TPA: NAD(P)/FAD-dependent oxidoreductase [Stellaceae bacterium]|nr:NAD(P)/FAD-dependent oxidoreductase [Stellaceae bacterium]
MSNLPSEADVAVIGAGAAGIAAGRRLAAAGNLSVLVLEARERAGGRTWTVEKNGYPLDLGGEWLHSADRNVLTPLAEELGFELYHRRPDWTTRLRNSGATPEEEQDWIAEREAHYWAIHRAAQEPGDRPAASVLRPGGRWNALFDASSTWGNAVELERLSVKDNDRYEDSGVNWRVRRGYGTLLAALAEPLPIAFGAAVSRIDHRGRDIVIDTARGRVVAKRVVVAVPTSILASEALAFDPVLPAKLDAANGLPLGLADKLFFHFAGHMDDLDSTGDIFLVGSTTRRATMSYQARPFGRPVIQCFFGGEFAAGMEREGLAAMAAFAIDELAALRGSDIRKQLTPLAASFWRADEFARGSYSYAKPGHADDRAVLAAPVDDRIFFAGEATSPNFFSTVHGAYETGIRAAEAALAILRARAA